MSREGRDYREMSVCSICLFVDDGGFSRANFQETSAIDRGLG